MEVSGFSPHKACCLSSESCEGAGLGLRRSLSQVVSLFSPPSPPSPPSPSSPSHLPQTDARAGWPALHHHVLRSPLHARNPAMAGLPQQGWQGSQHTEPGEGEGLAWHLTRATGYGEDIHNQCVGCLEQPLSVCTRCWFASESGISGPSLTPPPPSHYCSVLTRQGSRRRWRLSWQV